MILGFKKQFEAPILSGTKKHTIREDITNRWAEGKTIHFATGVRTKNYNNFKTDVCKSVQEIKVIWINEYINDAIVIVDGVNLNIEQKQALAYNDGFANLIEFFQWFNKNFEGKIIHWTNLKYNDNKDQ